MSEVRAKYRIQREIGNGHGGKRKAGPGKKIGKPADIGSGGRMYAVYLDDETIKLLRQIHPIRSQAIRTAAKNWIS